MHRSDDHHNSSLIGGGLSSTGLSMSNGKRYGSRNFGSHTSVTRCRAIVVALVFAASAAGCAYRGDSDPVTRKFTWFSYLNADDLRGRCREGGLPMYRFVYNAVYVKQVRTYDIHQADGVITLTTRVIGPTDTSSITISDPFNTLLEEPLSLLPGRGTIRTQPLRPADLDELDAALAASGFFKGPPVGLRLASEDFFWIAAVCMHAKFYYNVYKWPSPAFHNATFPTLLAEWDDTGIPFNPPRQLDDMFIYGGTPRDEVSRFDLTVGDNGLVGVQTLF